VIPAAPDGPVLETARLVMRPPRLDDLDGWAAFQADEESTRWLGGPTSRSESWRGLMQVAGSWSLLGFGMFSVLERDTGRWVGRVGPLHPDGWPGDEVGWGVIRQAWGRGYATEAAAAAVEWAFDHLGWTEGIHCIDEGNTASERVAERLGSRPLRPGRLPPPHEVDLVIWGQTREEWRARGR
jgi:RimJ/RimL family protein N-acetyltransferase